MDGPDYRQQEEAEQEQWEAAETLRWYEEQAQIMKGMSDGNDQEHCSSFCESAEGL